MSFHRCFTASSYLIGLTRSPKTKHSLQLLYLPSPSRILIAFLWFCIKLIRYSAFASPTPLTLKTCRCTCLTLEVITLRLRNHILALVLALGRDDLRLNSVANSNQGQASSILRN